MSLKVYCPNSATRLAAHIAILSALMLLTGAGCNQSSSIPAEIVGDSMAPFLCGKRISQSCPQCEFTFEYGVDQNLKTACCPNCGSPFPAAGKEIAADRVTVDPNQTPNRWDVVAFKHDDKTLIKRVIGLPGETVAIIDGEVIVDGKPIVKPDQIIQQTKHLVFDSSFVSPQTLASLQQCSIDAQRAQAEDGLTWIAYRHQQNYPRHTPLLPTAFPRVEDNYGFNQGLSRKLYRVGDLIVQADLSLKANAIFKMRRTIGGTAYEVSLTVDDDAANYDVIFTGGESDLSFKKPIIDDPDKSVSAPVQFSNIDQNIKVVVAGETLVNVTEVIGESDDNVETSQTEPFLNFGFTGPSNGVLQRCRIWRDIHYFAEAAIPKYQLPVQLEEDEYFVIGDNVPVSRDSRHFGPVKQIIGTITP